MNAVFTRNLVRFAGVFLLAGALGAGWPSVARAIPLSTLLGGGEITVGDKLFRDWTLGWNGGVGFAATDPDLSLVEVTPLGDQPLNPGLRFTANGQYDITASAGFGGTVATGFRFVVDVLDPTLRITDNTLSIDATASIDRNDPDFNPADNHVANVVVGESLENTPGFGDPPPFVAPTFCKGADGSFRRCLKQVFVTEQDFGGILSPLSDRLFDALLFPGATTLNVDVSIEADLYATGPAGINPVVGSVSLNTFDLRFSQTTVPEPATLALFAAGLAGLGFLRRRRLNA